jgi:hypothetical protein
MKSILVRSLIAIFAFALVGVGAALAHGEPVIAVQPTIVAAGGQINVIGTEMEPDEVFTLTLEGPRDSVPLGKATATAQGDEGGFSATFTIPADTPPGSYTVRATTEDGGTATADLTITAASTTASAGPAMMQEASGEPHVLDRTKPVGQIIGVIVAALLSGGLGLWLVRGRTQ